MAEKARTELGSITLDVVADRGYYDSKQILACETAGITVTLPKPMTSNAKAAGRKRQGGSRPLGIPTVSDLIAQGVVKAYLEPELERHFHPDSYGYRPGKSALEGRWCTEPKFDTVRSLLPRVLCQFVMVTDGLRASVCQHAVENGATDGDFCLLSRKGSGPQASSD
jgi:hypothetical protein